MHIEIDLLKQVVLPKYKPTLTQIHSYYSRHKSPPSYDVLEKLLDSEEEDAEILEVIQAAECEQTEIGFYLDRIKERFNKFLINKLAERADEIEQNYEQTIEIKNIDKCFAYDYMFRLWITNTEANKEHPIEGQMFNLIFNFNDETQLSGNVNLGTFAQGTLIGAEIPNEITDPYVLPTIFAEVKYNTTINITLTPQPNLLQIGTWNIMYEVIDYNPKLQQNINFIQTQLELNPEQQNNIILSDQTTNEKEEPTRKYYNHNIKNKYHFWNKYSRTSN